LSSQHVVSAVVNIAKAFGMHTVAEGAEDDDTLRLLRELGVDHVQGYIMGRPTPARETLAESAREVSRPPLGAPRGEIGPPQ
jgi:EAL domain-containing protein (putative c-di-GMP-specific phosphodiesterase class I)